MSYPRLTIDVGRIRANTRKMLDACSPAVDVMGVTKGVSGDVVVARAFLDEGVRSLGDSRLGSLERLRRAGLGVPLWLLRSPGPSEIAAAVALADGSLGSDLAVLGALGEEAARQGRRHRVLLMVDLETGREGLDPEDVAAARRAVTASEGLELAGLGIYFDFRSDSDFQRTTLERFVDLAAATGGVPGVLSGGSSNVLHTSVLEGSLPRPINHLRVGTAPLLGISTSHGPRVIDGWDRDAFLLEAEVIEVKRARPEALLALGHLDAPHEYLYPVDRGIEILGSSSDHTRVRFERGSTALEPGDRVTFRLGYYAMSRLTLSPHTRVVYR